MKLKAFILIYLIISSISTGIAAYFLPAYASRLPWLFLIFVVDIYFLWLIFCRLNRYGWFVRGFILGFIFLPSILLLIFLSSNIVLSPVEWNFVLRTYVLGVSVALLIMRVPPLLAFVIPDITSVFINRSFKNFKPASLTKWIRFSFIVSALIGIIIAYGMVKGVDDFQVVEHKVHLYNLPDSFEGYKIVHISDLHLGRWYSNKPLQEARDIVNSLNPDLIVITGDIVNYSTSEAHSYKEILAPLRAEHGVYVVLGNHDYGDYLKWRSPELKQQNQDDMQRIMDELGWKLLENRNEIIRTGDGCLAIAGVAHYSTKKYIPNRADVGLALQGITSSCISILLSHSPQIINLLRNVDQKVDIVLAGHTHAMQIGLRVGDKEFSPASFVYRYWGGPFEIQMQNNNNIFLYVNRGLGHVMIPMRIGIKPEITLLVLTGQNV